MKKHTISKMMIHLLLLAGVVIVAFPFVWMILSSFKSLPDFF
ncbi:hypothetical protein RWE15_01615 [Virgibacillus halophilus]|uniref:Multiple sugar transport system permease protein n=3 Tax=Tigheibacillus halophilus TaxID=361280 RepID=A0ABU5C378_9BACI|nr:hypothetical protein [Virgibacillus halophilus]